MLRTTRSRRLDARVTSTDEYRTGMRIGLVIERFDPLRGGAEHWTYQHAVSLLQRGHEVHVITESIGATARRDPFVFHTFGPAKSRLARAAAAEKMLRSLSLDVIHDIGLGWYSDIVQSEDGSRIAQWEQKLLTWPTWARPWKRALIRTLPRYSEFRTLVDRQLADPSRLVVAVSQMCAADFQRYHDVPPERLRLVYHGTDVERFSPQHRQRYRATLRRSLGFRDEEVVALFVGHDFIRKGLITALRACRGLAASGCPVRLLVVGERSTQRSGRGQPRESGGVVFAGRVPDAAPYYCAADLFVLPTFYDPCSLSVGEAAASGLPVVTTRANGASELLTDGREGFILDDAADDVALRECLRRLVEPDLRQRMGQAARRLALRYSLRRNCDELIAVYEEIVQRSPGVTINFQQAVQQLQRTTLSSIRSRQAA